MLFILTHSFLIFLLLLRISFNVCGIRFKEDSELTILPRHEECIKKRNWESSNGYGDMLLGYKNFKGKPGKKTLVSFELALLDESIGTVISGLNLNLNWTEFEKNDPVLLEKWWYF